MQEFPTKLLVLVLASFLGSSLLMISARKTDPKPTLFTRLMLEQEGPNSCWDALLELQSCSSEVVLFFLNGETHLSTNCCTAITTIERHCWPSMLATIGITSEESDVLRGYCDAADDSGATTPPPATLQNCYNFPRLVEP
ncbi:hypothetical protein ACS0TY_003023 [Phlomoides rotata]